MLEWVLIIVMPAGNIDTVPGFKDQESCLQALDAIGDRTMELWSIVAKRNGLAIRGKDQAMTADCVAVKKGPKKV